jgi:hypothetical protein
MGGMDISLQPVETWTADNRDWLGSADGTEFTQTITLDPALFTASIHFPNGYVPSGVVLGLNSTTGFYGPYDDAASDGRQTARGFLFSNCKMRTGGPKIGAAIHWRGVIRASRLPLATTVTGGLDANGKTDLATKFWIR